MTMDMLITVGQEALRTAIFVAGPMLGCGLVAGLAMGILQSVTQVHEMTLVLIPKMGAVILALALFSPWMIKTLMEFTTMMFSSIATLSL